MIKRCLRNEKKHQKKLYKAFYGFACSIALRYASDREEASIIINKGFYLAFTCLSDYKETTTFKEWLLVINDMKNEISPNEVVKIYKMHGLKITVKEAEHILSFMDSMIQAVKKKIMENSP